MSLFSKYALTTFEIVNELFIALGSGVLGAYCLINHGIKTSQTCKTLTVLMITSASFAYITRQKLQLEPSKKKVVLITGCDTGLGFSLAQHIASTGFTVIAGFLNLESDGARELRKNNKENIIQIRLDITSIENIHNAVKTLENYFLNNSDHKLHAMVNNAGVMVFGEFEWLTEKLIQYQINVNLNGTMNLTNAFTPMIRQHKGRIITITSHCSQATLPGLAVYGATKAALAAWSDGIRVELNKYDVNVTTFIPGSFATESHIMAKQLQYVKEMHANFTEEQHNFYSDYFKRYNIYLSFLRPPKEPLKINIKSLYSKFNDCLLDINPKVVYKDEPLRYKLYHYIFKFSPYCIRDYFTTKFMQMPTYVPNDTQSYKEI